MASYPGFRFPPDIISHAVWLYCRFGLSFRDVEDLLARRGVVVTYEAIRKWCRQFGALYARRLRQRHGRMGTRWHVDELFVTIQGRRQYVWRAHQLDLNAKLSEQRVRPMRRGEDRMMSRVAGTAAALASFVFYPFISANAQTPAEASRSSAVASPTYVSLYMEVTVNRPAADVWKRFGGYCAVAEWMKTPCTITSGKDGELGAVRTLGGGEVLVGKTPSSYTYTQPVKDGQPYNLYHGTFEARPVTTTTSKLIYAFIYDNSMLPDDGAREADKARRTASFTERLQNMKTYIEGGSAGQ